MRVSVPARAAGKSTPALSPPAAMPVLDRFTTSFSDHEPVSSRLLPGLPGERARKRRCAGNPRQWTVHRHAARGGGSPPMSLLAHRCRWEVHAVGAADACKGATGSVRHRSSGLMGSHTSSGVSPNCMNRRMKKRRPRRCCPPARARGCRCWRCPGYSAMLEMALETPSVSPCFSALGPSSGHKTSPCGW